MRTVAAYWAALARTTANAHVHQAPRVTVPVFRDEPEAARADDGRGITAIAAVTGEGSPRHRPPAGSTPRASSWRRGLRSGASTRSSPRSSSTDRRSSRSASPRSAAAPSRRPDRRASRHPLDVWGTDWTGGGNVIETVISAVRCKLGWHAAMIEIVRGVGYRAARSDRSTDGAPA